MKLKDYKKLEESINEQDFNKSYSNVNKVMLILSLFGHFASIFLAYFFLFKLLNSVIESEIFSFICSLVILIGLELLKREIFDKFSLQYIKTRKLTSDVMPLFISSFLIVSMSFFGSIKGAKEFSSKSDQLEHQMQLNVKKYEDSVTNVYNTKIQSIELEVTNIKTKIEEKDKEQTILETSHPLTTAQRNRVHDLKSEKSELKSEISDHEGVIQNLKKELSVEVQKFKDISRINTDKAKGENETNSFLFVFISTLIELLILAGVYFNEYYKIRSYNDFKSKIERDPNYQKWILYDSVLDTLYAGEVKINDKLPTNKSITEMCKINGITLLPKEMGELMKLFNSIGIIKTSGSAKYFSKTQVIAKDILKEHFKIN